MSIEQTAGAASMRARLPPGGPERDKALDRVTRQLAFASFPPSLSSRGREAKGSKNLRATIPFFYFSFSPRASQVLRDLPVLGTGTGAFNVRCETARGATRDRWWLFYPPAGCSTLDPLPSVLVLRVQKKGERALPRPRTRREASNF
jgi:hypothetical protein